jgi:asparagine synthase (glutamine-hydrolysing)
MCGLILAPSTYPETKIHNALVEMDYRGQDCSAVKRHGNWILGHNRLAIQDLSAGGNQPFEVDAAGNTLAMFVGEFFAKEGLHEKDVVRQLVADPALFHEIDGFWAVAAVKREATKIWTDHLGIKPLYFWPEHRIVCSELEPMFLLEPRPPLDETYLSNCVKFGYDYSGRTPYEGIYQVPPGTELNLWLEGHAYHRYWDWAKVPVREEVFSLRETVEEAIRNRLISDRPIALLLSGGLDSSIIYYTLQSWDMEVRTFSVENGESEFLPALTAVLKTEDVSLAEAVKIMQEPIDLGSLVPQIQLARAVDAAGYRVCLTGDGADEVFGGYRRAREYDSQRSDIFCELPYYHLPRLDRVMMRSTVELRSPFLSPQVVAYGMRLPYAYRMNKEALKHAFTGVVPHKILWRPKHPLKTTAVIEGGTRYRAELVDLFRKGVSQ